MDRCNGHQILLDLRVKRAVNLTGGSQGSGRVRACLLVALLPALPDSELITSSGNRADVDYTGSRCWRWQAGKRWQGRSTFVLKTSHQPQLVILPCQRSTLCYHTGLFRAQIHFKTDQLRKCYKILFTIKKSLQHQRCCRPRAKQCLGFFAKWFCGGKSCKITLKEHISSNCHQKSCSKSKSAAAPTSKPPQRRW